MNIRRKEQQTILRFLLIGIIIFMLFPLSISFFSHDPSLFTIRIILFIFYISLYIYHKKTNKTELTIHIFLIGSYIVFCIALYAKSNVDIMSIWYFIIPLIASILLTPKQSLKYSALTIITVFTSFILYPDSASFMEKFRILAFGFFLFGTLYILSRSRQHAWNETEDYMSNLESKVKEIVNEKREQEKLLIQISKLASLGELLSSIAHQWKQPISSISAIGMNFRLNEELSKNPDNKKLKLIDSLEEQIKFMSTTMDDFRTFFNVNDKKDTFELISASKKLISMFEKSFKVHGIKIYISSSDSIQVVGFSNMYKQALLNVIINAKDAINENSPSDTNIYISFSKNKNFGLITVEDHAGGITENILDNIFKKNFTTKGKNGSGIGLAMTKEIIEDFCRGELTVENTADGTKFNLYIPLHQT